MSEHPAERATALRRACAVAVAVLVVGLAALHAHWAVGGTWATGAEAGDVSQSNGPRPAMWGVAGALVAAGALVLARVGVLRLGLPRWVTTAGCVFVALFALIMLAVSIADAADQSPLTLFLFLPVSVLLLAGVLVVVLPPRTTTPDGA